MGVWSNFKCKQCEYTPEVSGMEDRGMICFTTTILCQDCKRLYDVVTEKHSRWDDRSDQVEPRCPRRKDHKFRKWVFPDVCPKCGGEMEQSKSMVFWD